MTSTSSRSRIEMSTSHPKSMRPTTGRDRLLTLALMGAALAVVSAGLATAAGGPDAYGYTWLASGDPGGPVFSWIDITGVGTEVAGLSDDNAVGPVPLGLSFHYYWSDYTSITIGSNGWLSFNPVSNVASCFPSLPTAGGAGDNLIAPFMSDIIFSNDAGNTGTVYYYTDVANQRFIVSYLDVPFWTANAPGFFGSNSFQVILSAADNSITFQYLDLNDTFLDNGGCANDIAAGIENVTGNIGLQVAADALPPDASAIRFVYPDPVTFEIVDPAPLWHNDAANKGVFRPANEDIPLVNAVWNAGNTATTTAVEVRGRVLDLALTAISDETVSVETLAAQQTVLVPMTPIPPPAPGEYYFQTTTTNASDINPSNNSLSSEIQVVDTTQASLDLGYSAASNPPTGALSWTGGVGGGAMYFVPPVQAYRVDAVSVYVTGDQVNPSSDYMVQVLDDDGVNGAPGTVLASETIASGTFTSGAWVTTPLSVPVSLVNGGFYAAWIQLGSNIWLGTDHTGPISGHAWEKVGTADWVGYRGARSQDLQIRVTVTPEAISLEIFSDDFESGTTDEWSATAGG